MSQTILYVKKQNYYTILKEYDNNNDELKDDISLSSFTLNNISDELLQIKNEENSEYNLYKRDSILTEDLFRLVSKFLFDSPDIKIKDRYTSIYQPISHILLFSKGEDSFIFYYKITEILLGLQITTENSKLTFINSEEDYNNLRLIDGLNIYDNEKIITEKNELKYQVINSNSYYINLSKLLIKNEVAYKASFIIDEKIMLLVFKTKTNEYINVYFDMLNESKYKFDQYIILDEINLKKLEIEGINEEEENEELQTQVEVQTKRVRSRRSKTVTIKSTRKNNLYKEILKNIIEKNNKNNISDDFINYLNVVIQKEQKIEKINFVNIALRIKEVIEQANKMYESRYFNITTDSLLENYISNYNSKVMQTLFTN